METNDSYHYYYYYYYVYSILLYQSSKMWWEQRIVEEIMREREDEVRKINKGMHQVNQIYKVSKNDVRI